jgi:hypothetical protein
VEFTWISDSCFSGDLAKDMLPPGRKIKSFPMPADIAWRMRTAETRPGAKLHPFEHVISGYNAVLISGSSKSETSADANIGGRYNGALTYYLLQTLSAPNGLTQTVEEAVARTRSALHRNGYAQHPQLEGSQDMMQQPFLISLKKKGASPNRAA